MGKRADIPLSDAILIWLFWGVQKLAMGKNVASARKVALYVASAGKVALCINVQFKRS